MTRKLKRKPKSSQTIAKAPAIIIPKRRIRRRPIQTKRVAQEKAELSVDEQISQIYNTIIQEVDDLENPQLRELWLDTLSTFANSGDVSALMEATKWKRPICELDEFLFGAAYLGLTEDEVYPSVYELCAEIDTDKYNEVVCKGALGTGKTTGSNMMMARDLYKLSCMRSPQQTLGIQSQSSIVFTIQSVRLNTAKKAVFEELGQYIRNSPYFQQHYPYDPHVTSEMIFRHQNVRVMPVSSSTTGVISMNVIGGQLDEMNFMQKTEKSKSQNADETGSFDQAKQLYNTLARRRKSRFVDKGRIPGTLYLISSSRFPDDFTEQKAQESTMYGGKDPGIYVYSHSQWSAKGRDKFMDEEFRVQVGNDTYRSKVLGPDEEGAPGCDVITVPEDFRPEFEKDCDGALRDFAGLTTLATNPFFSQRSAIDLSMTLARQHGVLNAYNLEEVDLSIGIPKPDPAKLRTDITKPRHAHVDLGLTSDACGVAVGYLAGHKITERIDEETKQKRYEVLPVVAYDFVLRVLPPPGGEIQFSDIRRLLNRLKRNYGIPIESITYDGFQSVDSRQILNKQGYKTGILSVEKVEPWRTFREALYDERILLPPHNFVKKELAELETTVKNNKEKVDHRAQGTKDVADALVGVATHILRQKNSWSQVVIDGGTTGLFLYGDYNPETGQSALRDKQQMRAVSRSNRRNPKRKKVERKRTMERA